VKKNIITLFLLSLLFSSNTIAQKLSSQSNVSLLTCAPGEELYSVFGHSAIRIVDSTLQIDWVYNYGTFDFNTPNFYLKFANGELNYLLSVGRFSHFLPGYLLEGRAVVEQTLNLSIHQKQIIFEKLQQNALPENRAYRYDFFFDNCATRIRDLVFDTIGADSLRFNRFDMSANRTFRELYGSYLEHSPWIEFGIHLLLGKKADQPATAWDEMYLPDYLYQQFSQIQIVDNQGNQRSLVQHKTALLDIPRHQETIQKVFWPVSIFGVFMVIIALITYWEFKRQRPLFRGLDYALLFGTGLVSFLLVFLWFFTRHGVTSDNFNILWANPLALLLLVALIIGRWHKLIVGLATLLMICYLLFIIVAQTNLQVFPNGTSFLVISLLIRVLSISIFKIRQRKVSLSEK
jgi:hypothetical protein